ncbi:pentatricopeptide repeat-containing protein [Senna tora]|uniref:Pentatricopeptide repeat-containing protein n=1 Tax=Senna tora TaxID=362788 RepID=A0A834TGT0_9FABA|nr:pentatricopeptide repeat-containing protein [Senna tora]
MANNSWDDIDAKLKKLIEVMECRYGSTTASMDHLEASVDTAFATSRMDRIEASLAAIKKKVDALTHSIDCGLSLLDGLHKNVESTLTTDAPLPIVAIDMEDSIMSKIFDPYPTRPLMDESTLTCDAQLTIVAVDVEVSVGLDVDSGVSVFVGEDICKSKLVEVVLGVELQNIGASTNFEALQEEDKGHSIVDDDDEREADISVVVLDSQAFDSPQTLPLVDEGKGMPMGVMTDLENLEKAYYSAVLDMYSEDAYNVFDEITDRGERVQLLGEGMKPFVALPPLCPIDEMPTRVPSNNLFYWNALISGLVQNGNEVDGLCLFIEMRIDGIDDIVEPRGPSSVVWACANLVVLELGNHIHGGGNVMGGVYKVGPIMAQVWPMWKLGAKENKKNSFGQRKAIFVLVQFFLSWFLTGKFKFGLNEAMWWLKIWKNTVLRKASTHASYTGLNIHRWKFMTGRCLHAAASLRLKANAVVEWEGENREDATREDWSKLLETFSNIQLEDKLIFYGRSIDMNAEVKSGPDPSIEPSNKPKK